MRTQDLGALVVPPSAAVGQDALGSQTIAKLSVKFLAGGGGLGAASEGHRLGDDDPC